MHIGAHLSSSGGIHTAVDRAEAVGADSLQVFTQSPRTWRPTNHDRANLERFRERRAEAGLHGVLCHALYLCNFAAPKDDIYEKSVAALRNTMEVACAIGADGVVFHVGSHLGSGFEAGLERVLPAMEQVLELCSDETWLLMENSAGAGGTIGRSVDELATIYERLDRHPRLGICLDSCHLYVSGVDVTDATQLDALLDELDGAVGLDRLRRERLGGTARLEPRPARQHRRGPPRRAARRLSRERAPARPARRARGRGPREQGAGRERGAEGQGAVGPLRRRPGRRPRSAMSAPSSPGTCAIAG
jgi:deoxyribonuclease-4